MSSDVSYLVVSLKLAKFVHFWSKMYYSFQIFIVIHLLNFTYFSYITFCQHLITFFSGHFFEIFEYFFQIFTYKSEPKLIYQYLGVKIEFLYKFINNKLTAYWDLYHVGNFKFQWNSHFKKIKNLHVDVSSLCSKMER